jgi:hypothetical protein
VKHLLKYLLSVGLILLPALLWAQSTSPPKSVPLTALGLKLAPVPEVVYAQVHALPPGRGLLVVEVLPDSPAFRAGLARHDILLSAAGHGLLNADHLVSASDAVSFKVLRKGRETTIDVPLQPGPMAVLKPGGPPAVNVEAKPLDSNRLSVTFTYYASGTSKLERITCAGSLDEIKNQVNGLAREKRMSAGVKDLADVALDRIRVLNSPGKK